MTFNLSLMKATFLQQGYAKQEQLIDSAEIDKLSKLYDQLLKDTQKTKHLRSDLSGLGEKKKEKITQIMRPSSVLKTLLKSKAYLNALAQAKYLLGDDMEMDFDMLINKMPNTGTQTPLHQDAAYWINLPDKRAVSCWIAIDKAEEANGCMWFIPRKNQAILPHQPSVVGGALQCSASIKNAECIPLTPGDCTYHDGFTLHFSKGNITNNHRRALILNFRPIKMIELEREHGIDHTGVRKVRNK